MKLLNPPERVVRPRQPVRIQMPIVVCDESFTAHYERDESMSVGWDLLGLCHYLRDNWPRGADGRRRTIPIMFVCRDVHKAFLHIHSAMSNDPEWQVRLTMSHDPHSEPSRVQPLDQTRVSFFGWRNRHRETRYFHPISPTDFIDDFPEYGTKGAPEWLRLYEWGGRVRKWMRANGLRFAASRGGLSAQLLRDPRFYSCPRRKIPKLSNEFARDAMPGNFYAVTGVARETYRSVYVVDQQDAHHYAAETVPLPNADSLYAQGRYRERDDSAWIDARDPGWEDLMHEHGLLRLRVYVPKGLLGALPPWASLGHELQTINLYSNEVPLMESLGVEPRYASYALTSPETDTGLPRYARWAREQVADNPSEKPWLKPTLLSAYGILGARPRILESAYWRGVVGKPKRYWIGPHPITFRSLRGDRDVQSPVANTIHRGMIEAETRKLSIEMARRLEGENHRVLAIHADAVIVLDEGQQLPLLPAPWRVKHKLRSFRIIDSVSFESESLTILPGRRRSNRARR